MEIGTRYLKYFASSTQQIGTEIGPTHRIC
jgi:hypothetical protein